MTVPARALVGGRGRRRGRREEGEEDHGHHAHGHEDRQVGPSPHHAGRARPRAWRTPAPVERGPKLHAAVDDD